jgi:hypothetical protein
MTDNSKRTGAAIEAHYQFLAWLVPTIEKFPKSHKFTIGDRIEMIALEVLEALIEATYTKERRNICAGQTWGSRSCASCFDSQPTSDCWIGAGTSTRRVPLTIPDA